MNNWYFMCLIVYVYVIPLMTQSFLVNVSVFKTNVK